VISSNCIGALEVIPSVLESNCIGLLEVIPSESNCIGVLEVILCESNCVSVFGQLLQKLKQLVHCYKFHIQQNCNTYQVCEGSELLTVCLSVCLFVYLFVCMLLRSL